MKQEYYVEDSRIQARTEEEELEYRERNSMVYEGEVKLPIHNAVENFQQFTLSYLMKMYMPSNINFKLSVNIVQQENYHGPKVQLIVIENIFEIFFSISLGQRAGTHSLFNDVSTATYILIVRRLGPDLRVPLKKLLNATKRIRSLHDAWKCFSRNSNARASLHPPRFSKRAGHSLILDEMSSEFRKRAVEKRSGLVFPCY